MLIASSFDDIVAITVFAIFVSISFDSIKDPSLVSGGKSEGKKSIKTMIGMNIFYFVAGIAFGCVVGQAMVIFNKFDKICSRGLLIAIKFILMVALAVALPVMCHYSKFEESKYIAIIFFGYFCYRSWGENKPDKELGMFWNVCQPFLFSSVGASILFSNIEMNVFWKGLGIIFLSLLLRWCGTFFCTTAQGFTIKERAFLAFAWIPKATV